MFTLAISQFQVDAESLQLNPARAEHDLRFGIIEGHISMRISGMEVGPWWEVPILDFSVVLTLCERSILREPGRRAVILLRMPKSSLSEL